MARALGDAFSAKYPVPARSRSIPHSPVIAATLAHSEADKVKAAYSRASFAEDRKKLLAEWAKFAGPLATADVIPFKAA